MWDGWKNGWMDRQTGSIHTHNTKWYSALEKKEILPFVTTYIKLEDIILSEIYQRKILHDLTYMWTICIFKPNSQNRLQNSGYQNLGHGEEEEILKKIKKRKVEWWFPEAGRRGSWEFLFNGYRVSILQDEIILEMFLSHQCSCLSLSFPLSINKNIYIKKTAKKQR